MKRYLSILLGLGLTLGTLVLLVLLARISSATPTEAPQPAALAQLAESTAVTVTGEYNGLVELTHAFSGVYSDTTAPVAMSLGTIDLVLKLTQTGTAVNGHVGLTREQDLNATTLATSLVFTGEHMINGARVGPLVTGTFDGALLKLQSERVTLTAAGQTITRQFILTSTSVEDNGNILRGAYRETVWAFSPQPATVVGTFALRRPVFGAAQSNPDDPNTPPVAVDDAVATPRDQPVTINVLANDSDADGDPLTVSAIGTPLHGSATTDGQTIIYTPNPSFVGVDSFTYTILDGRGGAATATVTITVSGPPGSNQAPTAGSDSATTSLNVPVIIDVLANDGDPDGDPLTITIAIPPSNGTATVVDGKIVYTPNPGFSGADSFTYTVSDGKGGAATATVTVTVTDQSVDGANSLHLPIIQR
jgi:hypothetical protein